MSTQKPPAPAFTRRQFLKLTAATFGGLALLAPTGSALASTGEGSGDGVAILIDISRCIGCNNCQRACRQANNLNPGADQLGQLSSETYTFVQQPAPTADKARYLKRQCMHCLHPACVSACTVGALKRTAEGVVVADTAKCIGCRYCQYACPFNIPKFEWEKTLGTIRKCTFCVERLQQGQIPACAASCASGALKFGTRSDLLKEAHARILANPGGYVDHVYGEHEVGGTGQFYISDVSFQDLGLPVLGSDPAPAYAEAVMTKTPLVALGVAALATGTYTALKWRDENGKHTAHVAEGDEEAGND